MMGLDGQPGVRRAVDGALALACGGVLWLVALRSGDWDWYLSETHAHLLYSAIVHHGEFPLFSFFLNQGAYLLQDPQFPGLSPVVAFVLALGPEAGLRFQGFAFGLAGYWATAAWLRRSVSPAGAAFGAVSWTLGLGVLWRVAVGNDLFLWMLPLPLLLLLVERLFEAPTAAAALGLGLVTGLFILGPTFHAIIYLLAPAGLLWVVLLSARAWAQGTLRPRLLLLLAAALGVALLVATPRLLAWAALSMRRTIEADGTMALRDALDSLLDSGKATVEVVPIVGTTIAGGIPMPAYGVWESAVALPHLATLLALVGLAASLGRAGRARPAAWLALLLLGAGLVLTASPDVWDGVRGVAPFLRVSRRFLILGAFGLAVLAAIGFDAVERRVGRWAAAWQVAALALAFGSTAAWIQAAGASRLLRPEAGPVVLHPPPPGMSEPVAVYRGPPSVLAAGGATAGLFHSVGNPCDGIIAGGVFCLPYDDRLRAGPAGRGAPFPLRQPGGPPVRISHGEIAVGPMAPGEGVVLNLRARPLLGYALDPPDTQVRLGGRDEVLTVVNLGPAPVPGVRVVARTPVPAWLWPAWGAALLAAGAALAVPRWRRRLEGRRGAWPGGGSAAPGPLAEEHGPG